MDMEQVADWQIYDINVAILAAATRVWARLCYESAEFWSERLVSFYSGSDVSSPPPFPERAAPLD